ncbi:MAG: division/cell wall cluster transcriptional repressor MraZ [Thermoguttaceae bacterium]|jgi:MraZ protein|nr:division/cell wall cluster transcriptional repressor MraZ [Thermoguttaceae bacterium]
MPNEVKLILGEYRAAIDNRHRLSIPEKLLAAFPNPPVECFLAKERAGCLSLWEAAQWRQKLDARVAVVEQKLRAGVLGERRVGQVQLLGRLLSSRHAEVTLAERGRLVVPKSFREFLGTEPGGEVLVVGAAVCIEIWNPTAWEQYLEARMPRFRKLFDRLSA